MSLLETSIFRGSGSIGNVPRPSAFSSSLEMVVDPKSPVGRVFQKHFMTDDNR